VNSGLSTVQGILYCYKSCKLRHTDVSEKVKRNITKKKTLFRTARR
jgi:hypothetical protein